MADAVPIFKYMGAKQNLAPQIIGAMPDHDTYMEVFGGGLSVFWAKPKAKWNIINDINKNIINLYQVIQNEETCKRFVNLITMTPFSRWVFDNFTNWYTDKAAYDALNVVQKAVIYFYLIKTNFNGNMNLQHLSTGLRYTTNWKNSNIEAIEMAFRYLNSDFGGKNPVLIENLHYNDILDKYVLSAKDGSSKADYVKRLFIYLDPPYWVTKDQNYYEFNFGEEEHAKLRDKMVECDKAGCKWMISYDDVPEIRELYKNFFIEKTKNLAQTSSSAEKRVEKQELIITNYNIQDSTGLFGVLS
jgi:DNA adenine methylase